MRTKHFALGCLITLCAAANAPAGLIYTTGPVSLANGASIFSQENYDQLAAVNFQLAGPETIRSVDFWGLHYDTGVIPPDDNFRVIVFGNGEGIPDSGTLLGTSALSLVSRTDTGMEMLGTTGAHIQGYLMNLDSPISIPNSSTYWFGLQSTSTATGTVFAWKQMSVGGTTAIYDPFLGWDSVSNTAAFNLYDTSQAVSAVPEPSSFALLACGLISSGWFLRRRSASPRANVSRL